MISIKISQSTPSLSSYRVLVPSLFQSLSTNSIDQTGNCPFLTPLIKSCALSEHPLDFQDSGRHAISWSIPCLCEDMSAVSSMVSPTSVTTSGSVKMFSMARFSDFHTLEVREGTSALRLAHWKQGSEQADGE